MTLAEIIAEGERQIGNYQTMILPIGDARRLLAVARAAVKMKEAHLAEHDAASTADIGCGICRAACAAFDRAAGEEDK